MIEIIQECDSSFNKPDSKCVREIIELVLKDKGINDAQLSLVFGSDSLLTELKKKYFGVDQLTDVIAFNLSDEMDDAIEAEIYISLKRARINAKKYSQTYNHEVARLIIHALLHILGLNDKTLEEKKEMRKTEDQYLKIVNKTLFSKINE